MTGSGLESLAILVGHLLGDTIFQNDWMAKHKGMSTWICLLHCFVYSTVVWLVCSWFLPLWTWPIIFLPHYIIDRFKLPRLWMECHGQSAFATGPFSCWSVVLVDQVMHLTCLLLTAMVGILLR